MSSEDQTSTTTEGFIIALAINAALSAVFFSTFILCRRKQRSVYQPRLHSEDVAEVPPPELSNTLLSWMWQFWKIEEKVVYQSVGLDGLMVLKVFKLGVKFCLLGAPVALCILLPVNATGTLGAEGFDQLSLSNVSDDDFYRLLVVSLACWYFTGLMMVLVHFQYEEYVQLRLKFLQEDRPEALSILVRGLPEEDSSDQGLYDLFNYMYPDTVSEAKVLRNCPELVSAVNKQNTYVRKLESSMWKYADTKDKEGRIIGHEKFCFRGEKVDSVHHFNKKLNKWNGIVSEELDGPIKKGANSGFVTFKNLRSAALATQSLHYAKEYEVDVMAAPEPKDIYWGNIKIGSREKVIRSILIFFATTALIFLWSIPVAAVQGLVSIENLSKYVPAVGDFIEANPALKGFLEGFLPTIVVKIFMAILPIICFWLTVLQGVEAFSWILLSQIRKLFWFNFVNVFLVSTFAGTILTSIQQITSGELGFDDVLTILGESLPKVATFFINYVMLLAFGGFFLQLSGIVPIIVQWIKLKFLAKTPRERRDAKLPKPAKYEKLYPEMLLVFVLVCTYCCISPIIIIFALSYFCIGAMVMKYQLLYVNVSLFESGGLQWPMIFGSITSGLYVFQITMFGILLIKKSVFAFVVLPLIFITVAFYYTERYLFERVGQYMPVAVATAVDEKRLVYGEEDHRQQREFLSYVQPCFNAKHIEEPEQAVVDRYMAKMDRLALEYDVNVHNNNVDIESDITCVSQPKLLDINKKDRKQADDDDTVLL